MPTDDDFTTPTALLRREHELILRVAGALADTAGGDGSLDHEKVEGCITFIRLYVDALHHHKEEDFLFPSLAAHGLPVDGGPIAVMLFEHNEGRTLVEEMVTTLDGSKTGDEQATDRLRAAALGFAELIDAHISKENGILFQIADQIIEEGARQELYSAYTTIGEELFEGQSRSDLEALADSILNG